ncbi:PAS sensor protein [Chryseobacterium sp. StRB126]|uniref:hypothetical protein n=1 Tax=Chryseobacterium sp. StRB126 TaxID=878220 RepID=UPI0004E98FFC|nr:hypothetical protein [Chryseobacterium sp. StRB126]BAP30111.1 PAS sensor protein [Chryseobacterium sp. StRB126]
MKTNEEKLRVYAAYLPYKLEVWYASLSSAHLLKRIEVRNDGDHLIEISNNITIKESISSEDIKPIFWDLSYLTKEIEHEGKRFVPIQKLCEMILMYQKAIGSPINGDHGYAQNFGIDGVITGTLEIYKDMTICCYSNKKGKPYRAINQFKAYQKLTSWKLNVFQLPEDQFINKATLKL